MAQQVTCPNCKRTYALKPEFAGKKAKCKCGNKIQFPDAPADVLSEADLLDEGPTQSLRAKAVGEALEQSSDYSMAPPPLPSAPPVQESMPCRNCGAPLPVGTVLCTACGTNQRTGQTIGTQVVRNLPRAAPQRTTTYAGGDGSLSSTDWLLILFCGTIAFFVALSRGLRGEGWRMMITILVLHAIIFVIVAMLGVMSAVHGR